MNKIQFYPSDELYNELLKAAEESEISLNALVCDSLTELFCNVPLRECKSEKELTKEVFDEVEKFISDKDVDYEFDLMTASNTYADILNIYNANETSKARAKVGNNFAKKVGKEGRFKNVAVAINRNGNTKKNQNNAIVYRVVEIKD